MDRALVGPAADSGSWPPSVVLVQEGVN